MKTCIFLILLAALTVSCRPHTDGQRVQYDNSNRCDTIGTNCITSHQGEHNIGKCDVYIDGDTLYILFPAELPAYWGSVIVKVHGGTFKSGFSGVPFSFEALTFETRKAALTLGKMDYAIGDTLCGTCDFTFEEINPQTGQRGTFYYKGDISEVVRSKNFDPFAKEYFMTFEYPMALHELGEPLSMDSFSTYGLPEFRVELLNLFPASKDIAIRELTWDNSEMRGISDEGREDSPSGMPVQRIKNTTVIRIPNCLPCGATLPTAILPAAGCPFIIWNGQLIWNFSE